MSIEKLYIRIDTNGEIVGNIYTADEIIEGAIYNFKLNKEYYQDSIEDDKRYKKILSEKFKINTLKRAIFYWNVSDYSIAKVKILDVTSVL